MTEATVEKPPYAIPSMGEIRAVPPNGYRLVSTFSGAGGACLGYRWAGFETVWASEFVDAAREVYELNFPGVPVDRRDIRQVRPEEILERAGLEQGEVDLLEGSPPCASFSLAGKRDKDWGEIRPYSETEQRVDDLFFEFVRILNGVRPKMFTAENVAGLTQGRAKGYLKAILDAMLQAGYSVELRLLDSQWLGVPQSRTRVFFWGIRNDIEAERRWPKPLPYRYTIADALEDVHAISYATGRDRTFNRETLVRHRSATTGPSPTIQVGNNEGTRSELMVVERMSERYVPDGDGDAPSLDGYAIGDEYDRLVPGQSSEAFYNLVRPDPEKPSPTVTQTGANPDAASVTHPYEKRKFTIPELKRLCGFPDDFELTGSFSQRWERLGRSVTPPVTKALGEAIAEALNASD